jgi:hypothetical protein
MVIVLFVLVVSAGNERVDGEEGAKSDEGMFIDFDCRAEIGIIMHHLTLTLLLIGDNNCITVSLF